MYRTHPTLKTQLTPKTRYTTHTSHSAFISHSWLYSGYTTHLTLSIYLTLMTLLRLYNSPHTRDTPNLWGARGWFPDTWCGRLEDRAHSRWPFLPCDRANRNSRYDCPTTHRNKDLEGMVNNQWIPDQLSCKSCPSVIGLHLLNLQSFKVMRVYLVLLIWSHHSYQFCTYLGCGIVISLQSHC